MRRGERARLVPAMCRVPDSSLMRTDRSSSIAFLLSVGAIPLGCPSGQEDNQGQTSFATSVGNGASTNPGSDTSAGEDTDGGSMSTTGTTDPSDSTDPSTTMTTTTMSTTDPSTDPSLTDPMSMTDPDTGYGSYGTYGSGGFQCTGAMMPVCQAYASKVVECSPQYAGSEGMIAYDCGCMLEYYAAYYGPACVGAIEDYYACIAQTSCQELAAGGCAQADMNVIETCGFGG
jgi:hypothetical protein